MAGCTPWCRSSHSERLDLVEVVECSSAPVAVRTLSGRTVEVAAVRCVDAVTGKVWAPEVRLGDDTVSVADACRIAGALLDVVDLLGGAP